MELDELLGRLDGVRRNGDGWSARCPAHPDRDPSLTVARGDRGIVLFCHAGCDTADVLAPLGIDVAELFDDQRSTTRRRIVDVYDYRDETGALAFQVVRFEPKDFRQRRPDGSGGYAWNVRGVTPLLYHLDEVVSAVGSSIPVWVVEGEKDVEALRSVGETATCNPGGAGKWQRVAEHARSVLAGAYVLVVADRDEPGRRHAAEIVASLRGVAALVQLLEPVDGCKDVAEHLGAGRTVTDFVEIDLDEQTETIDDDDEPSTWEDVDLGPAIAGVDIEPPSILTRTDGVALLYPGRTHSFHGEAESLKSWAAQLAAAEVLAAGANVLYLDFEDDDRGIVARLRSLGVADAVLGDRDRFRYVRPDEPLCDTRGTALRGLGVLKRHLEHPWRLAVVDGVTEAMTLEGLKIIDNTDVAIFQRRLPNRLARSGASVPLIDHLPKNRDGQASGAIGAQHKTAGLSGVGYRFTVVKKLRRALVDPESGRAAITVEKDRVGWVRAKAEGDRDTIAVLEITSYPDGGVTGRLLPPSDAVDVPDHALLVEIAECLDVYDGSSKTAVETAVSAKATKVREALVWLVRRDWVTVAVVGQSHRHSLTDLGRRELLRTTGRG